MEKFMSQVSGFYNSKDTVYIKSGKRDRSKAKNGDVKHIIFKGGEPVYTEIIRVNRGKTPDEALSKKASKRIKTAKSNNSSSKRSNVITDRQKSKLADRLNDVMRQSLTIWSSKTGLYISYQGKNSFLVKKFSPTNRVLSQNFLTKEELLSGDIPEIFTTTWKKM
jgi:hypothetical protein